MLARLRSSIPYEDVAAGARFLWSLPGFLRHPISVEHARAILRRRLEEREADFLALVCNAIYGQATSPYRELLNLAGCEYGDLERLVAREGVEGSLHTLFQRGVYLTVDESKGRRPVVRGSATLAVNPVLLRNPCSAFHTPVQSGGSRGTATPVPIDLAWLRDCAVYMRLIYRARGDIGWLHAVWGVPGGAAMLVTLLYSRMGAPPVRWFSQVDPAAPGLHPRYRWSARGMRWGSLLAGVPLPRPQHVPLTNPLRVAHWMAGILRAGGTPHLYTFASSAVRLCRAALDAGVDLRGAQLTLGSEPITAARLAAVRRAGAEAVPGYGTAECNYIGTGCLAPEAPDDLHLVHDTHALIQPGPDGEQTDLPPSALLISSLRRTAPVILLNVSLGDQAVVARRACGCPLERLGWATHLHTVRSYEKLTAGGMTFLDTDVIRVLEEVLPARFGGGPTDYQLLEEEAPDGQPDLQLLVEPALGPLDPDAVTDAFLGALGGGSGVERVMATQWRQGRFLRVQRRAPLLTASGKVLHLHVERQSPSRPTLGQVPPPGRWTRGLGRAAVRDERSFR